MFSFPIPAHLIEELAEKFMYLKREIGEKGLRENAAMYKSWLVAIKAKCDIIFGKWACGVCRKGDSSNSIFLSD